jgi:mevalonate kinase
VTKDSATRSTTAIAPGKVILFGEHAINRGQPALSAAVGLYTRCRVKPNSSGEYRFVSGQRRQTVSREVILRLAQDVEAHRMAEDYEAIRRLAATDFFSPQKYVLALAFGDVLPSGFDLAWESQIPRSSGLGSGGAAFVALVAALLPFLPQPPSLEQRAAWAHGGDIVAHGGIASALDTQTSQFGGIIRYSGRGPAETVPCLGGLPLVIGSTGLTAMTSAVNGRVQRWLAERPSSRMVYFETIGTLSRSALPLLERGEWEQLGRLITLNQLVLEKIGVSCPEIETLIEAALAAGAFGAKLSGSGGGGIIIALVPPERRQTVAGAIKAAGGTALTPEIAVSGVHLEETE